MSAASGLIRAGLPQGCRPWERHLLTPAAWAALPAALEAEPSLALLSLWAEPALVHAAFLDEAAGGLLLASAPAGEGSYAALSPVRPGAVLFERAIHDLWALRAEGGLDGRRWLDHGRWAMLGPLAARPAVNPFLPVEEPVLPAEGEGVHVIPVGPIHAGVIEPGYFRFSVQGEAILRLEARLGFAHKGTLSLMQGRSPRAAARFAARLSGDSTVAHSWAFALAAEAATGAAVPPRASALRALMAEIERAANHLNDWGFICNDAGFAWIHARCALLREGLLRAAETAFGHRLMMDRVIPGGVALDIAPGGAEAILAALAPVEAEIPLLLRVHQDHASLQDRVVGTGILRPDLAARLACGGVVGRASGRGFDARLALPHAPYDALPPVLAVEMAGDVEARVRVRVAELGGSLGLVRRILGALPPGEVAAPLPAGGGEGLGCVEGFRGEILTWMSLDDGGLIRAIFPRDPSWLQWPGLEAAVEGNIVADFPLCNKSFNCSYSGVDL